METHDITIGVREKFLLGSGSATTKGRENSPLASKILTVTESIDRSRNPTRQDRLTEARKAYCWKGYSMTFSSFSIYISSMPF